MALRSDDKFIVIKTTGGEKQEAVALSELDTYISSGEDSRLTALETSVDTATTGLLDRTTAIETTLDTETTGLVDRVDVLESIAQTAAHGAPVMALVDAEGKTGDGEAYEITWTAVDGGADGNDISITIVAGSGISQGMAVAVAGTDITVTLGTDGSGDPDDASNTATAVITIVNEHVTAGALVQGAVTGGGGVCAPVAKVELTGGLDITAGLAGDIRYSATAIYVSNGISTAAVSNWKVITYDAE